jgi:hypothetical protein
VHCPRSTQMTEAEYDVERAKVGDGEGLRQLFRRCGWSQTKIAATEGRSQQWVSAIMSGAALVRFGRNIEGLIKRSAVLPMLFCF